MVLGQVYLQVGSRGHKRTRHNLVIMKIPNKWKNIRKQWKFRYCVDGLSSVKGLLYMKIPPRYRICSEQKKNLIDRTQAADYLDKEINATNIDGKSIQITDISLVYAVDELASEGIQCSPYWRFGFQKRKNSESVWLYKDLNEYDTYSDTRRWETSGKWIFFD